MATRLGLPYVDQATTPRQRLAPAFAHGLVDDQAAVAIKVTGRDEVLPEANPQEILSSCAV
ncbi:MAG: hypothetical protein WC474_13535, partial [Hydrogenophilaceae bacterium]